MKRLIFSIISVLIPLLNSAASHSQGKTALYNDTAYPLYPQTMSSCPEIPSPVTLDNGMEIIAGFRKIDNAYMLIPVTVENGTPRNYKNNQWGKGSQQTVGCDDFPALRKTGRHSDAELENTKRITGKPIEDITNDGRPQRLSYAGFMSSDETIVSVLKGDNRLVGQLGLTHPQLAEPLFHLWNIIHIHDAQMRQAGRPLPGIDWFFYNGRRIHVLDAGSGHGWQESIFNDGNLGMWQFEIMIEPASHEIEFLKEKYGHLDEDSFNLLVKKMTYIHTGEMLPYYIMRYGFYEGHTSYRADPVAIAFIFGLRSIEEIENAFSEILYEELTRDFIAR